MEEILIYESADQQVKVEVKLDAETVWLSLNQMADLFGRDKSVISKHLKKYTKKPIWKRKQLLQKKQQFNMKPEGKLIGILNFIILML